jgi:hypothetical protein
VTDENDAKPFKVHCTYEAVETTCDFCGKGDEVCATIQVGSSPPKSACYSCWHSEREKTRGYLVQRLDGWTCGIVGTLEEAGEFLVEMYEREGNSKDRNQFKLIEAEWNGDRRTHPAYIGRRRILVRDDYFCEDCGYRWPSNSRECQVTGYKHNWRTKTLVEVSPDGAEGVHGWNR